jgi:hypothetical protein
MSYKIKYLKYKKKYLDLKNKKNQIGGSLIGKKVIIKDLINSPQFNGMEGIVISYDDIKKRYGVNIKIYIEKDKFDIVNEESILQQSKENIKIGDKIIITDITSSYNGKKATVISYNNETRLYEIDINIGLKKDNLHIIPEEIIIETPENIIIGKEIIIKGLVKNKLLNGRLGIVKSYDMATLRYNIEIVGEDGIKKLKRNNFEIFTVPINRTFLDYNDLVINHGKVKIIDALPISVISDSLREKIYNNRKTPNIILVGEVHKQNGYGLIWHFKNINADIFYENNFPFDYVNGENSISINPLEPSNDIGNFIRRENDPSIITMLICTMIGLINEEILFLPSTTLEKKQSILNDDIYYNNLHNHFIKIAESLTLEERIDFDICLEKYNFNPNREKANKDLLNLFSDMINKLIIKNNYGIKYNMLDLFKRMSNWLEIISILQLERDNIMINTVQKFVSDKMSKGVSQYDLNIVIIVGNDHLVNMEKLLTQIGMVPIVINKDEYV